MRRVQRDDGLEQAVEGAEDLQHGVPDHREGLVDWYSVAQGWEAGEIAIHLHLTVGPEDGKQGDSKEWCADIERAVASNQRLDVLDRPIGNDLQIDLAQTHDGGYQYSMLIGVGEVAEPAQ